MSLTPIVRWAQRANTIFVTVDVPDVNKESAKITVEDKKLTFAGKSGEKEYAIDLELFGEVDAKDEDTKFAVNPRNITFHLVKKEEGSWPRVLETKAKLNNVKVDFDKWVDSDEEDEDSGFNTDGMQGMDPGMMGGGGPGGPGGMGGMGGMGGPGGPGGAGGMDMAALMKQMQGMGGGAGGPGGAGGMDMASMMAQMGGGGGAPGGGGMPDMASMMAGMGGGAGGAAGGDEGDSDDDDLPDLEMADDEVAE